MNEAQRQAMLEAMGIDTWFPRTVLPGAAPSSFRVRRRSTEEAGFPVPESGIESARHIVTEPAPDSRETRDVAAKRAEIERETSPGSNGSASGADESREPARARPPTPQVAARSDVAEIHLKLAFIVCSNGLCLVNDLPLAGNGRLGRNHLRLLDNITRSLGVEVKTTQLFQWPLLQVPGMDNGSRAAASALVAFMEESAGPGERQKLIVMGERLKALLGDDESEQGADTGKVQLCFPTPFVDTYSLDQLMKLPALKREAWQALRQAHRQPHDDLSV